jgi:hypothetical protein
MGLIDCPDCKGKVSDIAPACPHCGRPFERKNTTVEKDAGENGGSREKNDAINNEDEKSAPPIIEDKEINPSQPIGITEEGPLDELSGEHAPPDIADQEGKQPRPRSVDFAVQLLWASIALSVLGFLLGFAYLDETRKAVAEQSPDLPPDMLLVIPYIGQFCIVVVIVPVVFLTYKIDKGRNWARIVIIVWNAVGLVAMPFSFEESSIKNPILGTMFVTNIVLCICILYYLCKKSSVEWFKSTSVGKPPPKTP